jgi:hypothetical protein
MTVTDEWRRALRAVVEDGQDVMPTASAGGAWRGRSSRELLALQTRVPMSRAVLGSPARQLGKKFLVAEAAWILSGDNRLSTIRPFAKNVGRFSDEGLYFFGAYGPRFVEQRAFVLRTLRNDQQTRQAVINVWREQPRETGDTPCTLSWQLLCRRNELHCVATMRSSDLVTGWVYDVFNFSMVAAALLLDLRALDPGIWNRVSLGTLYLTAGSQHLYRLDQPLAQAALAEEEHDEPPGLTLSDFPSSQALTDHLWALARGEPTPHDYLQELFA